MSSASDPSEYVLMLIGWNKADRLDQTAAMDPKWFKSGIGCPTCLTGERLVSSSAGATFVPTDAAEAYVLTFVDIQAAHDWVAAFPNAFAARQVYGMVPQFRVP